MVVVIIYTFLQVVIGILEQAYTLEAHLSIQPGTGIDQEIFDLGLDGTHTSGSDIGFRFRIGTNDILYAANHSGSSVVGQCYDTEANTPISRVDGIMLLM